MSMLRPWVECQQGAGKYPISLAFTENSLGEDNSGAEPGTGGPVKLRLDRSIGLARSDKKEPEIFHNGV
jgi:hypothetical protein